MISRKKYKALENLTPEKRVLGEYALVCYDYYYKSWSDFSISPEVYNRAAKLFKKSLVVESIIAQKYLEQFTKDIDLLEKEITANAPNGTGTYKNRQ